MALPRQLTVRAVVTGVVLGMVLSVSNVYVGLKIGWSFGVSLTASVLAYAMWRLTERFGGRAPVLLENVMTETCAGAAGYMASSGLNSAIPAFAMLVAEGVAAPHELPAWKLMTWIVSISAFGIFVASAIKRTVLDVEELRFPSGTACAEALRSVYATGADAVRSARHLSIAALVAGAWKVVAELGKIQRVGIPLRAGRYTLASYGIGLPPGLLLFGAGAIVGVRVSASLAAGALAFYGVLGPVLVHVDVLRVFDGPKADLAAFAAVAAREHAIVAPSVDRLGATLRAQWGVWPGAALLLSANVTSLLLGVRRYLPSIARARLPPTPRGADEIPLRVVSAGLFATGVVCVALERVWFDIPWLAGVAGVGLAFVLSVVAARATGLTDVPPIGALGKVAQLVGAGIMPGAAAPNLLFANVSSGAAAHASELLTDLKTGKLLGASPREQLVAQLFGLGAGAFACVPAYLALAHGHAIGGPDLPAPAAAAWKATALFLARGASTLPRYAPEASVVAALVGVSIATAEELLPERLRRFLPSATGLGIAFLLDGQDALAMLVGALVAEGLTRLKGASLRFDTRVIAAGLLVGESLVGVAIALYHAALGR